MVVGENEKFVSALISPNFNYLHFYASKHKIHYRENSDLIKHSEIINKIQKEINLVNETLGEHERIKRFRLVCEEWSQQTGELSPTLKLKRNVIYKNTLIFLKKFTDTVKTKPKKWAKKVLVQKKLLKRKFLME